MPGLLTTNTAAILHHIFINIFIPYCSLRILDIKSIKSLVKAKIGHYRSHNRIGEKLSALLHITAVHIKDRIPANHISLLIHTETAVRISVVGKANIQSLLHYKLLETLDMGGTGIVIDIGTIRLSIDHISLRSQRIKNRLCDIPCTSVGTVQSNPHSLKGIYSQGDQISYVTVPACRIIHRPADLTALCKRNLMPFLSEQLKTVIQIILHQSDDLLLHLLTLAVDQLDPVIIIRIMAGRDHDTAVKAIGTGNISHRRRCCHVEKISIRSGRHQSANQRILKHIAGTSGILADHDPGRSRLPRSSAQFIIIPSQKTSDLKCMIRRQRNTRFSTEAICTKIFSHF